MADNENSKDGDSQKLTLGTSYNGLEYINRFSVTVTDPYLAYEDVTPRDSKYPAISQLVLRAIASNQGVLKNAFEPTPQYPILIELTDKAIRRHGTVESVTISAENPYYTKLAESLTRIQFPPAQDKSIIEVEKIPMTLRANSNYSAALLNLREEISHVWINAHHKNKAIASTARMHLADVRENPAKYVQIEIDKIQEQRGRDGMESIR